MSGLAGVLRRLRRSPTGQALAARLGAGYVRLVRATTRWRIEGMDDFDRLAREGTPFIAVIWHGRLAMSPTLAPPGRRSVAMISNNRDGDLIAAIVRRFGVEAVRGSTYDKAKRRDKGGAEALQAGRAALEAGAVLAITPDGPRGPRMRAQAGAAQLASVTGAPVIPVAFSTARGRLTRGWDRFLIPLPFGRGAIVCGAPLRAAGPGAGDVARLTGEIEAALTAVTDRADALCGRAPVAPGDPAEPIPSATE